MQLKRMAYIFILLTGYVVNAAGLKEVTTQIYSLEAPTVESKEYSILSLADGRVYKIDPDNALALSAARVAASMGSVVVLALKDESLVADIRLYNASHESETTYTSWLIERSFENESVASERKLDDENYRPTVLDNKRDADKLFNSVFSYDSGYDVEDNCFNRAHYWARSFYVNAKVKSKKVFVLFTGKYRRQHNFKWWYHVAPSVLVSSGAGAEEWVLDPTFLDGPTKTHPWSLEFAEHATKCFVGKSMKDFRNKDLTEDCVLLKASMYHYTPPDLENPGSVTNWRCSDLKRVIAAIPPPFEKPWSAFKGFLPAECR